MKTTELLRWQWQGYARYHRSQTNLIFHLVLVPLFILSNVSLVRALIFRTWVTALLALAGMLFSIALQGRFHRSEPVPPEPFEGPANALARIFAEQWITFPRFVFSGGWLRALRESK